MLSISCMLAHVHIKVPFLCELFLAQLTFEGFDPLVLSKMYLEPRFLRIGGRTQMTLEWFHISMVQHMCFQMTLCDECQVALGMWAAEGAVICLQSTHDYVRFKALK